MATGEVAYYTDEEMMMIDDDIIKKSQEEKSIQEQEIHPLLNPSVSKFYDKMARFGESKYTHLLGTRDMLTSAFHVASFHIKSFFDLYRSSQTF